MVTSSLRVLMATRGELGNVDESRRSFADQFGVQLLPCVSPDSLPISSIMLTADLTAAPHSIGIRFLPKGTSSTPTATGSTAPPGSTSTGAPAGKVFMNVIFNGAETGCLISTGKWMVGSTCAGESPSPSGKWR